MTASPSVNGNWGWLRDLWERDWVKGLLLVAAVLFVYQPSWHGGFIWDDNMHISANGTLRSVRGLWDIWFQPGATCQYYPLSFTVFWVDYHLWGLDPLGYHLQTILLHGLASCLLWQVLKRLEVRGAWLAGAIFALHPVNVMSVAWMTELKNTLAGVLVLGAAWSYLRFARLGVCATAGKERIDWRYGVLTLALFQLAMFAKTAASFLPVTLLLVVWWKGGRLTWRRVWPVAAMFGIAVGMGLLTFHIERLYETTGDEFRIGLLERVLISGRSFWFYLGKLFFPYPLTFIYERWTVDTGVWWQYGYPVATLGLLAGLLLLRKRLGKGLFVAFLHFYVATSMLVLIQVLSMMLFTFVSDHWQYFGCISVMAAAAAGLDRALDSVTRGRLAVKWAGCGALLLTLGVLTWRQCGMYASPEILWRTTIARNPNCWMAHNNLGLILAKQGNLDEAIQHYERALHLKPDDAKALNNMGAILVRKGQPKEAIPYLQKALKISPDDPDTRHNLALAIAEVYRDDANALVRMGRNDEAIIQFKKVLEFYPGYADARHELAVVFLQKGQVDEAIAQFQKIQEQYPDKAIVYFDLGNAYFQKGHLDEAVMYYQKALTIQPDDVSARNNLGNAFLRKGMVDEAIAQFQKVLAIQPDFALARTNLNKALLQKASP